MGVLYFLIALLATTLGAISGFGGGVMIKPVLDAVGHYNSFVIGVLSAFTVLCMAIVSTVRNKRRGFNIDKNIIFTAIGAFLGGVAGKELFGMLFISISSNLVTLVQAGILIVLLVLVLFKNKMPQYHITDPKVIIFTGFLLGTLSSFLGIGGGPFNIIVISMLFGVDIKRAMIASIFIILFSQIANMVSTTLFTGFGGYDYSMLYFMIPGGIIGGFIGAEIGGRLSNKTSEKIYYAIIIGLLALNAYNVVSAII